MCANVLLVHPWNYHDESLENFNPDTSWRNGPFNIALLATILEKNGHKVKLLDLEPALIFYKGDVGKALFYLQKEAREFRPDIIGVTFFSVHYLEVKKIVKSLRKVCEEHKLPSIFVAGGIHASVAPKTCVTELEFDYAFIGEGEIGLLELANGVVPSKISGLYGYTELMGLSTNEGIPISQTLEKAQFNKNLDELPFIDWGLTDFKFYAHPSSARLGFEKIGSLDMEMGRGCVYKCSFCAYNALSGVRFHSAEYLVEQMVFNMHAFGVNAFYFTDSTIGNNRRVIREMCEIILSRGLENKIKWLANIRSNQVNKEDLKLMWRAGCRFLFYGFESNSQRMLDAMQKACSVESNEKAALLHKELYFPYTASMLFGFPGETEADLYKSIDFIKRHKPPSVGINWYVPLPGSPDYDALELAGKVIDDGPERWRRLGEVNDAVCYADVEPARFRQIYDEACHLAYNKIPSEVWNDWRHHYELKTRSKSEPRYAHLFKNVYSYKSQYAYPNAEASRRYGKSIQNLIWNKSAFNKQKERLRSHVLLNKVNNPLLYKYTRKLYHFCRKFNLISE